MAIESDSKLTKFESATTVVTSDFANSIYGGLRGTVEGARLPADDTKIIGHVHDGMGADGHAQKVNLKDHVVSKLEYQNLENEAVHVENVWTTTDPTEAIPEYILGGDGSTWYYLDLSTVRSDFTFKEIGYPLGDPDFPAGYNAADDLSLNPDPALGMSAVPMVRHGSENYTADGFDFVFGSSSLDDMHGLGHSAIDGEGDNRFLFDRSRAAFRAGSVSGDHWNEANRGAHSASFGKDNTSSGMGSFSAGFGNKTLAEYSSVCGGQGNSVDEDSQSSFLGGGVSNSVINSQASTISGGNLNEIGKTGEANTSFVGGGISNQISGINNSAISGGALNIITGTGHIVPSSGSTLGTMPGSSVVGAGYGNRIDLCDMAVISGGCENSVLQNGSFSAILGGEGNIIEDKYGAISGGSQNKIYGGSEYASIFGGDGNEINLSNHASISGGKTAEVINSNASTVSGGEANIIADMSQWATVSGGFDNQVVDQSEASAISGGKANRIGYSGGAHIGGGFGNQILNANFASASGWGAHSYMRGQSSRSSKPFEPFSGGTQHLDTSGGAGSAQASSVLLSGHWGYGGLPNTPGSLGVDQHYVLNLDGHLGSENIFVGLGTSMSFCIRGIMTGYEWISNLQESISFEVRGLFVKKVDSTGAPGDLVAAFGPVTSISSNPGVSMDASAIPGLPVGDVKLSITSTLAAPGVGALIPTDNRIRFDITESTVTQLQWTSTVIEVELVENRFYWDGAV
jgi:hypothetical protein